MVRGVTRYCCVRYVDNIPTVAENSEEEGELDGVPYRTMFGGCQHVECRESIGFAGLSSRKPRLL